jgi:hypothetical protein
MMCFFPVAVASSFRDVDDRRSTEERVLAKEAYAGALTNSKPKNETCPGRVFGGEARQTDFSVAIIDRADNISYFGVATVGGLSGLAEMAKTQEKNTKRKRTHHPSSSIEWGLLRKIKIRLSVGRHQKGLDSSAVPVYE